MLPEEGQATVPGLRLVFLDLALRRPNRTLGGQAVVQDERHLLQYRDGSLVVFHQFCLQELRVKDPARVLDGSTIGGSMASATVDRDVHRHAKESRSGGDARTLW